MQNWGQKKGRGIEFQVKDNFTFKKIHKQNKGKFWTPQKSHLLIMGIEEEHHSKCVENIFVKTKEGNFLNLEKKMSSRLQVYNITNK